MVDRRCAPGGLYNSLETRIKEHKKGEVITWLTLGFGEVGWPARGKNARKHSFIRYPYEYILMNNQRMELMMAILLYMVLILSVVFFNLEKIKEMV